MTFQYTIIVTKHWEIKHENSSTISFSMLRILSLPVTLTKPQPEHQFGEESGDDCLTLNSTATAYYSPYGQTYENSFQPYHSYAN
jgi:hypothetical protein